MVTMRTRKLEIIISVSFCKYIISLFYYLFIYFIINFSLHNQSLAQVLVIREPGRVEMRANIWTLALQTVKLSDSGMVSWSPAPMVRDRYVPSTDTS